MRACACAKLARSAQPPIISGSHGIHWTCSIVIHAVVLLYFNVIFKARIRLLGLDAFADRIPDERCWLTGAAERMDVGEYRGERWNGGSRSFLLDDRNGQPWLCGTPKHERDFPDEYYDEHWPRQEIPLVHLQTFDTCLKINRYILTTHYNLFCKSIFLTN